MITPHCPTPSEAQLAWHRSETNLFIHFSISTFGDREWGTGTESPQLFHPTDLDCRQWAQVAKAAGFQIAILTAKHHDGFCLWPSRQTDHSVKSSPWRDGKGDLVREFVDAFRAEGIKVGLYLSPWDRHEPSYGSEAYNDFYCAQLTELLTEYGELHEVWFDGACGEGPNGKTQQYDWPRYFELVRRLQPNAVTFGDGGTDVRWVGNERGIAGETCWATVDPTILRFPGDSGIAQATDAYASVDKMSYLNEGVAPDGSRPLVWSPAECDVSIRPGWFYHAAQDAEVKSAEDLLELYFKSVGRNGTLLLNIPPAPTGRFAEPDIAAVIEFRERLQRLFAHDLAAGAVLTASSESPDAPAIHLLDGDAESFWAPLGDDHAPSLEIALPQPMRIDLLVIWEAIRHGQRVAEHTLEFLDATGQWQRVISSTSIGHQRIHRFPAVEAQRLRLTISRSFALPALSRIALYSSQS